MTRAWTVISILVIATVGVVVYEVAYRGRSAQSPPGERAATVIDQKTSTAGPAATEAPLPKEQPATPPEIEKAKEPPEPPQKASPEQPTKEPAESPKKEPEPQPKKQEPAGPPAEDVLKNAKALIDANKAVEAQKLLSDTLTKGPTPANTDAIKALLTKLNDDLLFSTKRSPLAVVHVVKAKELLAHIAKQHKTTVELTADINTDLKNPNLVRVDQKLKIIPGAFDVEVIKSKFLLTVTWKGLWIREFKVGLGKEGSTPTGAFVAGARIKDPPYTAVVPNILPSDHKNNPLGTRWIGIDGAGKDYGIHGTWEPNSIGKEASKGCIRMRNEDVEWLSRLIVPGESKISIKP